MRASEQSWERNERQKNSARRRHPDMLYDAAFVISERSRRRLQSATIYMMDDAAQRARVPSPEDGSRRSFLPPFLPFSSEGAEVTCQSSLSVSSLSAIASSHCAPLDNKVLGGTSLEQCAHKRSRNSIQPTYTHKYTHTHSLTPRSSSEGQEEHRGGYGSIYRSNTTREAEKRNDDVAKEASRRLRDKTRRPSWATQLAKDSASVRIG